MHVMEAELGIPFPIKLENSHVIEKDQLCVSVLTKGPCNIALNGNMSNRSANEYQLELGRILVNLARIVPDGMLVFFPSYTFLDTSIKIWKSKDDVWKSINNLKKTFVEPRDGTDLQTFIRQYVDAALQHEGTTKGAGVYIFYVMFSIVCRLSQ